MLTKAEFRGLWRSRNYRRPKIEEKQATCTETR